MSEVESSSVFTQPTNNSVPSNLSLTDNDKFSSNVFYEELVENPISPNNNAFNFDINVAQKRYDAAISSHLVTLVYTDNDLEFTFNQSTFIVLDPIIATLSPYIQSCFFNHINNILDDLKTGIQASMQLFLLKLLISDNLFWSGIAQHLGFTAPTIDTEIGKNPSFLLPSMVARESINKSW